MIQRGIVTRPIVKGIVNRGITNRVPSTTLTLDLITTQPAAAFSLRKIRADYNGSCLRIRRSSDNAEQDFGFVGSALDTAAITSFVGVDTAFVVRWYDQSANANDAIQTADITKQPTYASTLLTFDGTNDFFNLTSAISRTNGYTVFSSLQASDTATTKGIISGTSGALFLRIGTTEAFVIVRQGAAVLLTGSSTGLTANNVTRWRSFSTGNSIHYNGVSEGSNATNNALTQDVAQLFSGTSVGGDLFAGTVQEMLIYTADLDTSDSNILGNNMATFAGTTWSNI